MATNISFNLRMSSIFLIIAITLLLLENGTKRENDSPEQGEY